MAPTFPSFSYWIVDSNIEGNFMGNVDAHGSTMGAIFIISLFAVSFPGISKRSSFLPIPKVLFFVGKHFGTGVILSTAFCHLLEDAFESLWSPEVAQRYPAVRKQTGLIILTSLLVIFLIEYISTSYVDHLHAEPSAPPSRAQSVSPTHSTHPYHELPTPTNHQSTSSTPLPRAGLTIDVPPTENSPLLTATPSAPNPSLTRRSSSLLAQSSQHYLSSILTNSPRYSRGNECFYIINDLTYHLNHGEYHIMEGPGRAVCVSMCPTNQRTRESLQVKGTAEDGEDRGRTSRRREERGNGSPDVGLAGISHDSADTPRVGRKRQVVGILVLQLGIMIHSLVIGLTLAITHGAEFTTLVTAIIFHQLFEGLSLGIRIAGLPPPPPSTDTIPIKLSPSRSPSPSPSSALSSRHPFESSTKTRDRPLGVKARILRFLVRIQPFKKTEWLQPTLSLLFAVTTPAGMALGALIFKPDGHPGSSARLILTQGLMSAISAGMLIYAATVEMLGGDFVFGNLGGHGHSSGGHSHGGDFIDGPSTHGHGAGANVHSHFDGFEGHDGVGNGEEVVGGDDEGGDEGGEDPTPGKKVLAVVSLLAGVVGMGLIGIGE